MNDTPIEIFIDNGAIPSILPLCTSNQFPILHMYPRTESNTPIHTGGSLIKSHFWLEIPLKFDHQTIHIKSLVCDSECPYDLILGHTSIVCMARLHITQAIPSTDLDPIDCANCCLPVFLFCCVQSVRWCEAIVVRGCTSSLLGSYVHQELI